MLIDFDGLLKLIDDLSPEQKQQIRQHLEETWSTRFGVVLQSIHEDMPVIPEDEVSSDVEAAIREVRSSDA